MSNKGIGIKIEVPPEVRVAAIRRLAAQECTSLMNRAHTLADAIDEATADNSFEGGGTIRFSLPITGEEVLEIARETRAKILRHAQEVCKRVMADTSDLDD